ncbi:Per1p SCDLUD_003877 [Saccharomycodes ludwigii]|uniref:Per1p n=1 Tax=Saccharomycodes ludwigii TaxID=36035 RepID=UPI001E8A7E4A|nr:hypothetical protein SCDLUD_003877 [Saccharomycodes ludwigii]KAH3899597.1 hypothetical protein SCDLUD_003877 [Saccharomycodes ludwigii]
MSEIKYDPVVTKLDTFIQLQTKLMSAHDNIVNTFLPLQSEKFEKIVNDYTTEREKLMAKHQALERNAEKLQRENDNLKMTVETTHISNLKKTGQLDGLKLKYQNCRLEYQNYEQELNKLSEMLIESREKMEKTNKLLQEHRLKDKLEAERLENLLGLKILSKDGNQLSFQFSKLYEDMPDYIKTVTIDVSNQTITGMSEGSSMDKLDLEAYLKSDSLCSPGDRLPEFTGCRRICEWKLDCPVKSHFDDSSYSQKFPLDYQHFDKSPPYIYKLLKWDCNFECDYQCQQIITKDRVVDNKPIYQFHGKWPFTRRIGIQELFSTLFSIGNFIPHYRGFKLLTKKIVTLPPGYRYKKILQGYRYLSIAGMLAWFFSSVFHTRDLLLTEKLDYFFAGGTVLTGFYSILTRILLSSKTPIVQNLWNRVGLKLVVSIFICHIVKLYMNWSYTYNMRFNIAFGILQYILLISLSIQNYFKIKSSKKKFDDIYVLKSYKDGIWKYTLIPILLVIFTCLGMCFEIFDIFIYSWQIDSHALWHLSTIIPSWFLYDFFLNDFHAFFSPSITTITKI